MFGKEGKGSGHEHSVPCCGICDICVASGKSLSPLVCLHSFSAKRLTTAFLRGITKKNTLEMGSFYLSLATTPVPPEVPEGFPSASRGGSPWSPSTQERFRLTTVYSLSSHSPVSFAQPPSMIKSSRNELKGLDL